MRLKYFWNCTVWQILPTYMSTCASLKKKKKSLIQSISHNSYNTTTLLYRNFLLVLFLLTHKNINKLHT